MSRREDEPTLHARIPANIEQADKILFGLTGRQVVILSVTGLLLYTAWTALATVVHPLLFATGALPVTAGAFLVAVTRRDGLPLDRWLLAAWHHRRAAHHLVPTEGTITPAPAWITTTGGPGHLLPLPAPLRLPARGITADGQIDLGPDGTTALVTASTVVFGLRTGGEQNALVTAFARWLHSLDSPTQVLVRAHRVDLGILAEQISDHAPGLPHPALEDAARSHAAFLEHLAGERDLLHRQVTIAVRDPQATGRGTHRAAEAVRALTACEVTANICDPGETAEVLAACLNPGGTGARSASPAGRITPPAPGPGPGSVPTVVPAGHRNEVVS